MLKGETTSFFHSSAWANVLLASYGYRPLFFTLIQKGRLQALIPLVEVRSVLTGRRGVSLPFSDDCEPIMAEKKHFEILMQAVLRYARKRRWKTVQLRGGTQFLNGVSPASWFYRHTLDLDRDEEAIFRRLKGNTKRNIRKAIKEDVQIHRSHSLDAVRAFYRLNTLTRREHGLPPQPFSFFRNIHTHIISPKKGLVILASYGGRYVAGAVYFHFGTQAIYKYGASDRTYQDKRPNNRVMWEAIQCYTQNGFRTFSFGRTEPNNSGLLQFKRSWGAREGLLRYYTYDLRKNSYVIDHSRIGSLSSIFRKMPGPLLNVIGSLLYRHVG